MSKNQINKIKDHILQGNPVSLSDALLLANTTEKEYLYAAANEIRKHFTGDKMDLCSIINARSGKCSEDCKWCAQSAHHKTDVQVYELISKEETLKQALNNQQKGVHKFSLVTSGRTLDDKHIMQVVEIYKALKSLTNLGLCASLGLLNKKQLEELKKTGIEHYHCNLETAPSYFPKLCTTHTIEEKLATIKAAKEAGLKICSGGIIGMGESMEQRIELAFELRKIGAKSIPLNILNPIKGTKLEGQKPLTDDEVLTTIALFRFINPDALIRFAGGRNMIAHIEHKALNAGINAALVGDLLTTVGKNIDQDLTYFKEMGFDIKKHTDGN